MSTFSLFHHFAVALIVVNMPSSCEGFQNEFWSHLSTKTKYSWARVESVELVQPDELMSQASGRERLEQCTAVHTTVVARHGTRYPGLDHIQAVIDLHNRLNPNASVVDHDLLRWRSPFPYNDNLDLAPAGALEMNVYGQRTAKRLRSLFHFHNSSDLLRAVRLSTSERQRAKDSGRAFMDGFGKIVALPGRVSSTVDDLRLHYHSHCAAFVDEVKNNDNMTMKQHDLFARGSAMARVQQGISRQLGGIPITTNEVMEVYHMCANEMAVYGRSPWCQLLAGDNLASLLVLEYMDDLQNYYKYGPSRSITMQQSSLLISSIFEAMDQVAASLQSSSSASSYHRGYFGFGHAETLSPMLSALGLFDGGVEPRADNFWQAAAGRKFRSSRYLVFAANIQFILYSCPTSGLKLKMLVNERETKFPFAECADTSLCPLDLVKEKYKAKGLIGRTVNDFNMLCHNGNSHAIG